MFNETNGININLNASGNGTNTTALFLKAHCNLPYVYNVTTHICTQVINGSFIGYGLLGICVWLTFNKDIMTLINKSFHKDFSMPMNFIDIANWVIKRIKPKETKEVPKEEIKQGDAPKEEGI